jgi:hypothetical protein
VKIGEEELMLDSSLGVKYRNLLYRRQEASKLVRSRLFHINSMGSYLVLSLMEKDIQLTWSKEGSVRIMVCFVLIFFSSICLHCSNVAYQQNFK